MLTQILIPQPSFDTDPHLAGIEVRERLEAEKAEHYLLIRKRIESYHKTRKGIPYFGKIEKARPLSEPDFGGEGG
ncbi:MAG: hypothetical protein IMZ53_10110 [Thermoplasmata archaeon]|nr:hypothetical protein [Thermoplasmata archaeon]